MNLDYIIVFVIGVCVGIAFSMITEIADTYASINRHNQEE